MTKWDPIDPGELHDHRERFNRIWDHFERIGDRLQTMMTALDNSMEMCARQSVWEHWIRSQGRPVPPELRAPLIEGEADTVATSSARVALPAPSGTPPSGTRTTAEVKAEDACREWLESLPEEPRPPKESVFKEAHRLFGVSERGFGRIWAKAVPESWHRAGAPKKSPR